MAQKSIPQVVFDNEQQGIVRIKIKNDSESRKITLKYAKNKLCEKV